jgi:hypothetical protein
MIFARIAVILALGIAVGIFLAHFVLPVIQR